MKSDFLFHSPHCPHCVRLMSIVNSHRDLFYFLEFIDTSLTEPPECIRGVPAVSLNNNEKLMVGQEAFDYVNSVIERNQAIPLFANFSCYK
jgi:glutaredoxin-related protein